MADAQDLYKEQKAEEKPIEIPREKPKKVAAKKTPKKKPVRRKPVKKKSHAGRRALGALLLGAALVGSGYVWDRYDLNDRTINKAIYFRIDPAEGFTENPLELSKVYKINEKGDIETYFGNRDTGEFYAVKENDRTGDTFDLIQDKLRETYQRFRQSLDDLVRKMH